ncbi:MAG: hypothetical protein IK068_01740, partial [Lachnospiraceae bacterium]|nr:hypothetical protein [Lachnospiraceae bacterium]
AAEGYTLAADETTEFMLADETQLKTVNVTVTNVGEVGSQEEIDAAIDLMLPDLQSTYEGIGLTDVTIEKETITFAGAEYTGAVIKGSMDADGTAVDMVARQIYMVKDGYMACITATSFAEDATAELLAMGSALN